TADFTPTQPACANPTQGSLSIDLTGDNDGNLAGLEYAIVAGNSFSGTPAFSEISADPFDITSGFGTTGDFGGKTYTVRIRLKYNPGLYVDETYTLTAPCNCTVYVNDDAAGANNGTSWTDAFTGLQDALAVAGSCSGVTEIWVAEGSYKPTGGTDRSISFVMQNNLAIYGGFPGQPGQEGDFGIRDWAAYPSILSGDIGGTAHTDNSYRVIDNDFTAAGPLTSSAVLDGFTVQGAYADGSFPLNLGGGMWNSYASPTIRNCIFRNNYATAGGGIFNADAAPTVINCLFTGNTGTAAGAGISNGGGSDLAQAINCTFYGNTGPNTINNQSNAVFTNCIVWGNDAGISGGVVNYSIVQGGYGGTGNLDADPLFVDPVNGDYTLQDCSPAINSGINAIVPPGITTDLNGDPRFFNNGAIDRGAFEYQNQNQNLSLNILYVNKMASGNNDGTSWTDALTGLRDALALANSCSAVTEIWVAAGTYYPTTGTDRAISFFMANGVAVYGGFPGLPGQEGDFGVRDWAANATILSGDIGIPNDDSDNSYHVIFNNNGLNNTAILDGFTITGGRANGLNPHQDGGGMYNMSSSPRVANCKFINNSVNFGGAGIYNASSSPVIINCQFIGNSGGSLSSIGAGIFNVDSSNPAITNCTFAGNNAFYGGGISNWYSSNSIVINCIFWGNSSSIDNQSSNPVVNYSIIQGGHGGTGNLDEDPLFVDPAGGDFRLQPCSPAVNAGDNAAVPAGITTDLDGNPRFYNAGTVDMGAYEYQGGPYAGNILYVNDDASGNNDGTSWTDAFTDLQDALAATSACSNVTEIWVAAGTYKPTTGMDRTSSFTMKNNLAIYGGFPGTPGQEGDFNLRDWTANETILSGDIGTANAAADNSYHVILNNYNGLNNTAVLDGFTITGGNADGSWPDDRGGGMYNSLVSPQVVNCSFIANHATRGGGVYNTNPSTPTFVNCLFYNNLANDGGGVYNDIASARYQNCTFSGNNGFAVYNVDATPSLANCIIWGNDLGVSNSG
ncbi:MAG: right-handed parallel beta-helix repeat-containing protein, partial [Phaeodactylibacter sp.]|nr:right-handed parallel beta-helix repeat-containing protein [Phaeodactylibacter sp.]